MGTCLPEWDNGGPFGDPLAKVPLIPHVDVKPLFFHKHGRVHVERFFGVRPELQPEEGLVSY